MEENQNIQQQWLTEFTGDTFADVGGYVIQHLYKLPEFKEKSILDLIRYITNVYTNNWNCSLHSFFLNSVITVPNYMQYTWNGRVISAREASVLKKEFDSEQREEFDKCRNFDLIIQKSAEYYGQLIDGTIPFKIGHCAISGVRTKLFPANRNNSILTGSGTFINYHPSFESSSFFSKEMLIRLFFVPFGVHFLGDKLAIVKSNVPTLNEYFVSQNVAANLEAIKSKSSNGVLKSEFSSPANALFKFADYYLNHLLSLDETQKELISKGALLSLWHFTNFGQKPEIVEYNLQSSAFKFYTYCNQFFKEEWTKFVVAHYRKYENANITFNEETSVYEKKGEEIPYEEYSKWRNLILNCLLHNFSIIKYFLTWVEFHEFPFEIIEIYLIQIRKMHTKTLSILKSIADFIVTEHEEDFIKQHEDALNRASNGQEFSRCIVKIQDSAFYENASDAILSPEEFANDLVPQGKSWIESRNTLIIAIRNKRYSESLSQ